MNKAEILAAIAASEELQAMGADVNAIAAALSVGRKTIKRRIVSSRGLAELYPGGVFESEIILMKLEGTAATLKASEDSQQKVMGSLLARQLSFLAGEGLDFGSPALRGMLDTFSVMGILTSVEVTGLKSIAEIPDPVTSAQVSEALGLSSEEVEKFTIPTDMQVPGTVDIVVVQGREYSANELVNCCNINDLSRTVICRYPARFIVLGEV